MQHPKIFRRASRGGGYRFSNTLLCSDWMLPSCIHRDGRWIHAAYWRRRAKVGGYIKMRNGLVWGRRGEAPKDFDFFIWKCLIHRCRHLLTQKRRRRQLGFWPFTGTAFLGDKFQQWGVPSTSGTVTRPKAKLTVSQFLGLKFDIHTAYSSNLFSFRWGRFNLTSDIFRSKSRKKCRIFFTWTKGPLLVIYKNPKKCRFSDIFWSKSLKNVRSNPLQIS